MNLEFLKSVSDFQYSVNLELDLMNNNKVKAFIPTTGSLSVIKEVLASVMSSSKNNNRAKILTSSYGKGKSHLTLTLLALLAGRDKKLLGQLIEKAKLIDIEAYNLINSYIDSKKKLLPIIIKTPSNSLKTNFANSLNVALTDNGLEKFKPKTFFDSAIEAIKNWKYLYPDTYKLFEKKIGIKGETVITELQHCNQEIYNNFEYFYPSLTSGSNFNPIESTDIAKLYANVINDIKSVGYSGIFVVYDEFGKFLEGSSDTKSTADDLKLLQDLAELSARTDGDAQFNLLLISHKGIDNYVSHLAKEKIDNWKAIAGRFEKIALESNDEEIFGLIASVLHKEENLYNAYYNKNKSKFDRINSIIYSDTEITTAMSTGAFSEVRKTVGLDFIKDCYPLHPYSLLILPKISELVAQNERSIFTFLASTDKNSVSYYMKRNNQDFPLIEPDVIYDYFESLFKGEPYGSPIREQWETASTAIAKISSCENELAIKIIKTTTLIYIINKYEVLPPSSDLIYEIYKLHPYVDVASAFELLRKEELLIELEFKPYIRIRKSSNNNLNEVIDNEIKSIRNIDNKNILLESLDSPYIKPADYNAEKELVRYFEYVFLNASELESIDDIETFIGASNADGVLIAVLVNTKDEIKRAEKKAKELNSNRVVYIIPKEGKNINEYLKKYLAVSNLIEKNSDDALLIDELTYIQQDLGELIYNYLSKYYIKPELKQISYIHNGRNKKINRRVALSQLLSNICREVFYRTPTIINENINRDNISTVMNTIRKRIINGVLSAKLLPNLNLLGSQNLNVARSVYLVPGLIPDLENPVIDYNSCDPFIKNVLDEIDGFIKGSANNKKSFVELYNILTKPKYGYGLKLGIIPFYVAVVMRKYRSGVVIYFKNREQTINEELLVSINNNPSQFEIRIESLGEEKEGYLDDLYTTFNKHIRTTDAELSRFETITNAMQSWYLQLPKYSKQSKYYYNEDLKKVKHERSVMKVKSLLGSPEINPREFLFEKLLQILSTEKLDEVSHFISKTKADIDRSIDYLVKHIGVFLHDLLGKNHNASLYSVLQDYYASLNESTKVHVFNNATNSFLKSIIESNNDSTWTVKNMLRKMYSLHLDDFTDELVDTIESSIVDAINTINEYNSNSAVVDADNSYTVTYPNEDGTKTEIHFSTLNEKSYQSNMFYNEVKSSVEDFNEALSSAEKGQILLEIIKELCK